MKFETSEEICKIVCSCKNYSEIFRNFPKKQLPCFTDAADHYNKCKLKFSQESFSKISVWNMELLFCKSYDGPNPNQKIFWKQH